MPEYSRMQTRHQKRRSSNRGALALTGIIAVLIVAGLVGGAIWITSRRVVPATRAAASTTATASVKPASAPNSGTTVAPHSSSDATPTASSETLAAAAASERATAKACLAYPNAAAISPTTPSVSQLRPRHKYIALTLDDGYDFQPELLDLLKRYDAHCTTFLIGSWASSHKQDLKLMRDAGFEIANHSWTHPFLTQLSSAQIKSELTRTQKVISSVTGNQAPYLRPPYGSTDSHVKAAAAGLGYRIVLWNRSFGDSGKGANVHKVYRIVHRDGGVHAGDVILCHWGSKPSYQALKIMLPELKAQGFQLVTISELIADSAPQK
jgi:peptidoglycan/xylan/chitin deacetylase (PgdA/CDA1 family)